MSIKKRLSTPTGMEKRMQEWETEHRCREMRERPDHERAETARKMLIPETTKTPPLGKSHGEKS